MRCHSDTAGVLSVLALLAVLISCLGLLGMATYTAETRRKEISVRKVLWLKRIPGYYIVIKRIHDPVGNSSYHSCTGRIYRK